MFSFSKINGLRNFSTAIINKSYKYNAVGGARLVDKVAVTDNGKMFVAWHPDQDFPYECTQPIPKQEAKDSASLLKDEAINNAMAAYRNKLPEVARQELMNLTYTTKHRWFPRARDKKAKKTPMDREYL